MKVPRFLGLTRTDSQGVDCPSLLNTIKVITLVNVGLPTHPLALKMKQGSQHTPHAHGTTIN